MDDDSDLMWKSLNDRLHQRFGNYFKIDEERCKHETHDEQYQPDVNVYKMNLLYRNEHTNS